MVLAWIATCVCSSMPVCSRWFVNRFICRLRSHCRQQSRQRLAIQSRLKYCKTHLFTLCVPSPCWASELWPNFKRNFVDSSSANQIKRVNDITMPGILITADDDAEIRIGLLHGNQRSHQLIAADWLFVEEHRAVFIDRDIREIPLGIWGGGWCLPSAGSP